MPDPQERILLLNPAAGKSGPNILRALYEPMRAVILAGIAAAGASTFGELAERVEAALGDTFPGAVRWYFTSVKLDLEARGEIVRFKEHGKERYRLGG